MMKKTQSAKPARAASRQLKPSAPSVEPYNPAQIKRPPIVDLVAPFISQLRDKYQLESGENLGKYPDAMAELRSIATAATHANLLSRPAVHSAVIQEGFGNAVFSGSDINLLIESTENATKRIAAGDMSDVEAMLFSQATALNAMFTNLAMTAKGVEQLNQYQIQFNLALKAQAQCRATLEALAYVKNPPNVNFIRQQNNAGNQQVNNRGVTGPARTENPKLSNELEQGASHVALEHREASFAVGANPAAATLEISNRSEDAGG